MRILKRIFLFLNLILFFNQTNAFSQDTLSAPLFFNNVTVEKQLQSGEDTVLVVFFYLAGDIFNMNADNLESEITGINGVLSCNIFYNRICKLRMNTEVKAETVRKILQNNLLDYDIESIETSDAQIISELTAIKLQTPISAINIPIPASEWIYPENFPKLIDTGNEEVDMETFAKAKQEWMRDNPEAYKKMTGVEPNEKGEK